MDKPNLNMTVVYLSDIQGEKMERNISDVLTVKQLQSPEMINFHCLDLILANMLKTESLVTSMLTVMYRAMTVAMMAVVMGPMMTVLMGWIWRPMIQK
jgi:hypothetical protein